MCLVPQHCTICTAYFWAGCVGFLLSVMGCVGAWREKAGLVNCYAVLFAMISVGEKRLLEIVISDYKSLVFR